MKGKSKLTFLMVFMFLIWGCAAKEIREFSADIHLTSADQKSPLQKIYYAQDRWRIEIPSLAVSVIIVRQDKNLVWVLSLEDKTCWERPLTEEFLGQAGKIVAQRDLVGTEVIEGRPTKKYMVTKYREDCEEVCYEWHDDFLKFPLKIQVQDYVSLCKNIKIGHQDRSLFEIPNDYKIEKLPTSQKEFDAEMEKSIQELRQKKKELMKSNESKNK